MSATGWWAEVFLVVRPSPAVVHVTGGSPTILSGKRILAAAAALAVAGSAPTVVVTQNKTIQPSPAVLTIIGSRPVQGTSARPITGALTVTGGTPVVRLSDNKAVQPTAASLTVSTSAPDVSATANQFPTPTGHTLTITGGVPVVTASDLKLIRPNAASLTVTGGTPAAGVGLTFVPTGLALSVTMGTPTVTATQNKFVTPTNAALIVTGGQPVVRAPRLATPTNASLTVTGGTPTVTVAAPGAHYTDDFNRTNSSSLGASWTADPFYATSLEISGNAAVDTTTTGSGNVYVLPMITDDHAVTVVMKGVGFGDAAYITLRGDSSSATQYVYVEMLNGGTWSLFRNSADVSPVTSGGNQSWSDGDTIVFQVQGTTATLKRNGSTVLTATVTVTSGKYLLLDYISASTPHGFDSFDAQDI